MAINNRSSTKCPYLIEIQDCVTHNSVVVEGKRRTPSESINLAGKVKAALQVLQDRKVPITCPELIDVMATGVVD